MPDLEEAFLNFPLSTPINEWKQPFGVCNTLAIAWLEEKYLDGNFLAFSSRLEHLGLQVGTVSSAWQPDR